MRRVGRQCRGQGKVFVKLVRHTETHLVAVGSAIATLAQEAQQALAQAPSLSDAKRERVASDLNTAIQAHQQMRTQSRRLPQGKGLTHCKIVNAYDPTIAPICTGKSNCPTQFGRKPGLISEPTGGFLCATRVPLGPPIDSSSVRPLVDKVQHAIARSTARPQLAIHAVAGDLGVNDPEVRHALHARGIRTVGIPQEGRTAPSHSFPRGAPRPPQGGGVESPPPPIARAVSLCLWLQPPRGGKSHGPFARPWCWSTPLQRSAGRSDPDGHDGHGP
jgi:hypothetical protein